MMGLWHLWQNGGRLLVLAAAGAASSIVTLAVVFLAVTLWPEEGPFEPITVSEVTVNSRIDGVEGPAVRSGEPWSGTVTICNSDDKEHVVTFVIGYERLSGPVFFAEARSIDIPVQPGCETFTGDSAPLPGDVTPGQWRESSSAVVQEGKHKQTVSFVSEPFEVAP